MNGGREVFTCGKCERRFTYWVAEGNEHPKVKCSFCGQDSYPKGEPPAAPAPPPAAAPPPAKSPADGPKDS